MATKADNTKNAVFVSDDGKVSFDEAGYRLDSLGNRTYNNAGIGGESKPRYTEGIQKEIDKYNEEVARYESEMKAYLEAMSKVTPQYEPAYNKPTQDIVWKYDPLSGQLIKDKPLSNSPLERVKQMVNASSWSGNNFVNREQLPVAQDPTQNAMQLTPSAPAQPFKTFIPTAGTIQPAFVKPQPAPDFYMDANPLYGQSANEFSVLNNWRVR